MEDSRDNEMISSTNTVNIAILPSPGMGHLNPVLEFVKRLIRIADDPQRLSISFILIPASPSDTSALRAKATSFLSTLPPGSSQLVDFHTLPIPKFDKKNFSSITEQVFHEIVLNAECSLSSIRSLLVDLTATKKKPFSSIIVDMFGTPAFDVAFELGIKPYVFFPSSVTCLSLFMHLPKLDETVSSDIQFWEMAEPVKLPGCRLPIHGRDFPSAALDRKASYYGGFIRIINKYWLAKGIIVNSFESFEAGVITALRQQPDEHDAKAAKPTLYPIGPVTKKVEDGVVDDADRDIADKCLRWLDEQLPESVLYINFGSGGTLSTAQVHELAMGLELSGQRFLWVVRVPNDDIPFGAYLGVDRSKDPLDILPQGFLERTQGRVGLAVPLWAPQARILAHRSTGGFMSHCGWNSILEAVTNGVPFIVWPLYAEQYMNAQFLEKELEVALRVKKPDGADGVIGGEVIAAVAKDLIAGEQGKEMATKMKGFRDEAEKALGIDGSSTIALGQLAVHLFNSATVSVS